MVGLGVAGFLLRNPASVVVVEIRCKWYRCAARKGSAVLDVPCHQVHSPVHACERASACQN
eukprot:11109570-Prorocentrum_lima.AAC.1